MSALTSTRSTWTRKIDSITLQLPTGQKATQGGAAACDSANPGSVYPATSGVNTQTQIGRFAASFDNTSGSAAVGVQVILDDEITVRSWDSVTGAGAVTISNQLQIVYAASDHEVTTTAGSNSKAGRVWDVNGDGVWVQSGFTGQSSP